jgi:hypothetical protein
MSVTAIGDASPKSHKKSRSADSHAKDVVQERVKSKKRKPREATSDALPETTPKDQAASTTRDSLSTSHPLSPSSAPSARNVASKNVQLANLTTSDTERTKKNKSYSGDVAHEQLKDRSDERKKEKKEKTKKKLKHSDEGKHEGAALDGQVVHLNDIKVQTPEEATSEKSQRKKKRKTEEQSEEIPDSKPFKKQKSHHPFTDPSVDESLSDQSRKALSYAYARFEDPPNWKFNKARQIWLIKRLWSEEMIPEKYFALVTKYLADVKGGIRDNLIQMCNSVVATETPEPVSSESVIMPSDLSNGGSIITTKVTRARSLLGALSDV